VLFLILTGLVIGKLFYLQVLKHDFYLSRAESRHVQLKELTPERGGIYTLAYDKDSQKEKLYPLAINQQLYLLYGVPAEIKDATATIELIERVLPMTDEKRWQIFLRLNKKDPYEPIHHYVTQEQKEKIEKLFAQNKSASGGSIKEIGFKPETKRVYPQNNLFSHVLGFLGYEGDKRVGQYGIEEYFENDLAGREGKLKIEKDLRGRLISFGQTEVIPVQNGADLILTLDPAVQFKACSVLSEWIEKTAAEDGTAIVLDPGSGQILAMCNKPDFDLNNYSHVEDINIYSNKAISQAYEPGSIFKAITMAAAIDLERVEPNTTFEDKGFVQFGSDIIRNANNKVYGQVSMVKVLEDSINTGAVFAALKCGKKNFKKYVEKFGFGKKTGISLPAESPGDISSLNYKSDIYTATASYGQGIMTTPLQMIMAYGAIANGGILMKPQIVLEKRYPNGKVEKFEPKQVRRVISSKTANVLKAMLVSVVKNGHGSRAGVKGYYVAGKTGTANIARRGGKGYTQETNHTFIGFAPVDNPKFVTLVKLSKPKNVRFSSDSAAPAFAEIAEFLLHYYQVPPDF